MSASKFVRVDERFRIIALGTCVCASVRVSVCPCVRGFVDRARPSVVRGGWANQVPSPAFLRRLCVSSSRGPDSKKRPVAFVTLWLWGFGASGLPASWVLRRMVLPVMVANLTPLQ